MKFSTGKLGLCLLADERHRQHDADERKPDRDEVLQLIAESQSIADLTDRQLEILSAATQGHTTNDIARELGISESCVLKHFTVIFEKLGVANRSEAIALALRKHLLKNQRGTGPP